MRIVTAIYGAGRGGSERAALRLVRLWRSAGHDVVCVGEAAGDEARPVALSKQISAACAAARTDILFAPGQTYALPFALARRWMADAPPLVTKISNMPEGGPRGVAGRFWLARQAAWTRMFVAPDARSRAVLASDIPALGGRLTDIANPAADEAHLRRLHDVARPDFTGLQLLAAGRLVRQKNFAGLIRAFAAIRHEGDSLTILGDGPEREALSALASRLSASVAFHGHQADVAPWFARANAFASSSAFEGLPAVLIEAMAAGLPIAATPSSPAVEMLLSGGRGIVASDDDLAGALARLRDFRPDRARLYDTACNFTGERAAPAYLALFERLAESPEFANAK